MSYFHNCSGWPLVPLKDIATLKRGYDLPVSARNAGDVPIYAANGKNGTHNEVKVQGPGVITGRSGTIGKVHYTAEDFWPLNTSLYVTNFHGNHPRWVFYLLSAFKLERFSEGAGVPTLNRNLVHDELIPLPPLEEQKRIAAILGKADAIRRKRQQAIKLADDFLRAVFLDMFGDPVTNPKGWEVKLLVSLCNKITDGTHHSPPIVESGIPYVTAKHLKKTGLEFHSKPWYVSEEDHQNIYSRCNPEPNDVLYIKDGATTGIAAINEYDFEFSMLSSLALLKPNYDLINSEFLCMFLNHPRTKSVLTANMAGAAITRLTLAKIKNVKVFLPDLQCQNKFKAIYDLVRVFLRKINASEDMTEKEFNSLSQKAFSGEL